MNLMQYAMTALWRRILQVADRTEDPTGYWVELHTLELAAVYKMALVIAEERGLVDFCTRGPNLRVGLTKAGWEYVRLDFHTPVVINDEECKVPQYQRRGSML